VEVFLATLSKLTNGSYLGPHFGFVDALSDCKAAQRKIVFAAFAWLCKFTSGNLV